MPPVLESVDWGRPALSLLRRIKDLDPTRPAVMHIRHTERPVIEPGDVNGIKKLSTELGRKAAYEMGSALPTDRKYRLYHTYIERSKETVEEIHRGILSNDGTSEVVGSVLFSTIVDLERFPEYVDREIEEEPSEGLSMTLFTKWISGHFPPWIRVPAIEFAQRAASAMMKNLGSAGGDAFDIYVSHDIFVGAFQLFWFGVFPSDWVDFLDGFILQFDDERMVVRGKYGVIRTYPPHWWSF
jgi:hypothetical protein